MCLKKLARINLNRTPYGKPKSDGRLFERDVKTIGQYINNALLEELLDQAATVTNFAIVQKEGERSAMG
jgi:hypothetical protein